MKTDFLIIGGGVAGLSAANRLAEAGADVTLLEAGTYPSHKVCGEFLSPEAIPLLEKWEIPLAMDISSLRFVLPHRECLIPLPEKAATVHRFSLEQALAKRATSFGARIETNVRVEKIEVQHPFVVRLESGTSIRARHLLVSTGRIMQTQSQPFCYVGAKMHFEGISMSSELAMHLLPGAYFGMAPIAANRVNVAGLIACSAEDALDPQRVLARCLASSKLEERLQPATPLFTEWMVAPVPQFGIRRNPQWPHAFFLGDAAGTIAPATGNGLAMGLASGFLAAEWALKDDVQAYNKCWSSQFKKRIYIGGLLHRLFISPWAAGCIPLVNRLFPSINKNIFYNTRGSFN